MFLTKVLITFCALLVFNFSNSQETERKLYFKEVDWAITLPENFEKIDSLDNLKRMQRGAAVIEEANNVNADISSTVTLVSATKNKFNYFNATITPFDQKKDGSWKEANQGLKDMIYKGLVGSMKNAKLDSTSSIAFIDGIQFDKFHIAVVLNNDLRFNMYLLSRLYRGYDFGISYLSLDDKTLKDVESTLNKSKFYNKTATK